MFIFVSDLQRVNTLGRGDQGAAEVVALAGGGFVVGWTDAVATAGNRSDAMIQPFDATGRAVGANRSVAIQTSGGEVLTDLLAMPDGSFMVAWAAGGASAAAYAPASTSLPVFRHFAADGTALTGDVAQTTLGAGETRGAELVATATGVRAVFGFNGTMRSALFDTTLQLQLTATHASLSTAAGVTSVMEAALAADGETAIALTGIGGSGGELQSTSGGGIRREIPSGSLGPAQDLVSLGNGLFALPGTGQLAMLTGPGGDVATHFLSNSSISAGGLPRQLVRQVALGPESVVEAFVATYTPSLTHGFFFINGSPSASGLFLRVIDFANNTVSPLFLVEQAPLGTFTGLDLDRLADGSLAIAWTRTGALQNDVFLRVVKFGLQPGTNAADFIVGTPEDDVIRGFGGGDTLDGGAGNDTLEVEQNNSLLLGGAGDDRLGGGNGGDSLHGDEGRDTLLGYASNDLLDGGTGNDLLDGGAGADTMEGGTGNDTLHGREDPDTMRGGEGADLLSGGHSLDRLDGEAGNDTLYGGAGADVLLGGLGDDALHGGADNDVLDTGEGGRETAVGGAGNDSILAGSGNDSLFGDEGDDEVDAGGGNDALRGGSGDDLLSGGMGNDTIRGEGNNDTLDGGGGDDLLIDFEGGGDLFGGDGFDTASFNINEPTGGVWASLDSTTFGQGPAAFTRFFSVEGLIGTKLNDTVFGGQAANSLSGMDGADSLSGDGGADLLDGGAGADTLAGGDLADTLIGHTGADQLTGGAGADHFRFNAPGHGLDIITDFTAGDRIVLARAAFGGGTSIAVILTADWTTAVSGSVARLFLDTSGEDAGTLAYDANAATTAGRTAFALLFDGAAAEPTALISLASAEILLL